MAYGSLKDTLFYMKTPGRFMNHLSGCEEVSTKDNGNHKP